MADVQGVCVVVSHWFGGTHLGPSRFAIINNTARQLLVDQGLMPSGATRGSGKGKK
jgi:putative IMPACT (imprinted ancient) family translation regulator